VLFTRLHLIRTKELKEPSALAAGYAALSLTEGTQRWVE
jgi:hypothetical protein